jgi:type I restriction enzyme, S subunit
MEVKPGYKQTELGVIPEAWQLAELSTVTTQIGDGLHGTPVYSPNGHYSFINGNNLNDGRIVVSDETQAVEKAEFAKHRRPLGDRSILMSINGTIGNLALFDGEPVVLGKSVAFLNVSRGVSKSFIYHSLQGSKVRQQFFGGLTGSTIGNLGLATIRGTKIPLPPTEVEQRAIAEALSDADGLLGGLDRLIAKKRDLKQAAMQQLLTGQTRLPGFHGEWEVKRLGDVAHIKTGSRNNEDKIEDGQYPFFVRSEVVERINTYSHDCEAILVPGEGRIGSIFHYVRGRFDVHQRVYAITRFKPDISVRFIHLCMSMKFGAWAMQNTVKATVDSLRLPTFLTFEMTIPPTFAEQAAIADVLTEMDAELAALEHRREKTRALKQAMMQELLTGKTPLVQTEVAHA